MTQKQTDGAATSEKLRKDIVSLQQKGNELIGHVVFRYSREIFVTENKYTMEM